jgi:hypothetical protein
MASLHPTLWLHRDRLQECGGNHYSNVSPATASWSAVDICSRETGTSSSSSRSFNFTVLHRPAMSAGQGHKGLALGPPKTLSGEARHVDLGLPAWPGSSHNEHVSTVSRRRRRRCTPTTSLVFSRPDVVALNPDRMTKRFGQLVETCWYATPDSKTCVMFA